MILSNVIILLTGIGATAIAPAYGSLIPRSLGEPEVVAGHGRNLARAHCHHDSECPSGICTWGRCRTKNKDCKKDDLDWKCSTGTWNPTPKECVLKLNKTGNPKKWGKCKRIPTMTEVAKQYDKHEGHYISSQGLVNIDGPGAKVGSFDSGKFDFSYAQFQQACTLKCSSMTKCNAVSVVKWKLPANEFDLRFSGPPPFEEFSGKKYFHCDLFDTTVKVNEVAAAQMGPAPRGHVDDPGKVLTSRDNVVYAKKGFANIEDYKACSVRALDKSIKCALCQEQLKDQAPETYSAMCDGHLGITGETCEDTVGLPSDSDDELPELNRDFRSKVLPAAGCIIEVTGNADGAIESCFACLSVAQQPYMENKADSQVSVAKAICSKTDDINFLRGTCKELCHFEQCQAALETAMLCVSGIPLGVTKPVGDCAKLDFTGYPYEGGAINTPYTCPQEEE